MAVMVGPSIDYAAAHRFAVYCLPEQDVPALEATLRCSGLVGAPEALRCALAEISAGESREVRLGAAVENGRRPRLLDLKETGLGIGLGMSLLICSLDRDLAVSCFYQVTNLSRARWRIGPWSAAGDGPVTEELTLSYGILKVWA